MHAPGLTVLEWDHETSAAQGWWNTRGPLTTKPDLSREVAPMEPTHVCVPFEGRPSMFQAEAARVLFAAGRTPQSWHWITSTCDEPACLYVGHLITHQPLKLAYPYGVCVYCGLPGHTKDHLLPESITGKAARAFVATVPACGQCNAIINDRGTANITIRRALAHEGIRRLQARSLRTRDWSDDEVREFGPGLRAHVIEAMGRKLETISRLDWPHDPSYDLRALELSGIEDPYATGLLGDPDARLVRADPLPAQRTKSYVERAEEIRGHKVGDVFEFGVGIRRGRRIRLVELNHRDEWSAVLLWHPHEDRIGTYIALKANSLASWTKVNSEEVA